MFSTGYGAFGMAGTTITTVLGGAASSGDSGVKGLRALACFARISFLVRYARKLFLNNSVLTHIYSAHTALDHSNNKMKVEKSKSKHETCDM
jgi:hypothetical protein